MLGLCFGVARRPARPGPLFLPASFRSAGAPGRASARFGEGNAAAPPRPAQTSLFSPPAIRASWPRFVFSFFPPSRPRATVSAPHPAFFLTASVALCAAAFPFALFPFFPLPLVLFHPVSRPTVARVFPAARNRAQFWRARRSFFEGGIQAQSKATRGKAPRGKGAGRRGREEGDRIFFKIMPSRA